MFTLFRSLEPSYALVDQLVVDVEERLLKAIPDGKVIVRGSLAHRVAIQSIFDIDLDFIVPIRFCSMERMAMLCAISRSIKPIGQLCDELCRLLIENPGVFYSNATFERVQLEPLSRSVKLTASFRGVAKDIDIFPKFVSEVDGKVWTVSKEIDGQRTWICSSLIPTSTPAELSHVHRASVMLIKLWKKGQKKIVADGLKGYHVALAVERCVARWGNSAQQSSPDFRLRVRKLMREAVCYLREAYLLRNRYNEVYVFDGVNPFVEDCLAMGVNERSQYLELLPHASGRVRMESVNRSMRCDMCSCECAHVCRISREAIVGGC